MLVKIKRSWEIPERLATPESVYLSRRQLLRGAAAGGILAASTTLLAACDESNAEQTGDPREKQLADAKAADPSAHLYPVKRNEAYTLDRPLTSEELATTYNNYYEFGSFKSIWREAQALQIRPWTVKFDGLVEQPMEIAIDDLLAKMPLEERLYRHRCVERWSMAVPWSGFAMRHLVEFARPLGSAKYVRMTSFLDPEIAGGQRADWFPWPYVEGVTIQEAMNDMPFMVTGLYGKPAPKQNGAPLRIALPWKYGFKSIKGIVQFTFTEEQPVSFWEELLGNEYGFWANVNPEVPHPRWSQEYEEPLGTDELVPTLLYNGYAEEVAGLYAGMPQDRRLFM